MCKPISAAWYKRTFVGLCSAFILNGALMSSLSLMPLSIKAAEYSPNFKGTDIAEFINIVGKNLKKTMKFTDILPLKWTIKL